MGWSRSRFSVGDVVEILDRDAILATLDGQGRLEGMPFMPEMLRWCGKRVRVSAVAHKTCDTVGGTWQGRRLPPSVHLEGARCDGSAHGGCEAECNLIWNDAWLMPVADEERPASLRSGGISEEQLIAATRAPSDADGEPRYACQATELFAASEALPWWDLRQYVLDVVTGNRSLRRVARVLVLAQLRWLARRAPVGRSALQRFSERMHLRLSGRPCPSLNGKVPDDVPGPVGRLDLESGDLVRIKSQVEIEETIGRNGKNRGLSFDPEEMAPYCGRVVRVHRSVTQIIDEPTGKMIRMKQPCIMLEGVVCNSEYAQGRLNCPRAIPSYWRELWLEIVEGQEAAGDGAANPGV